MAASKTKSSKKSKSSKKGKMPKALRDYWTRMRSNPKKSATRHAPKKSKAATRRNPAPAARKASAILRRSGRQAMPLLFEALLGLLGYGGARMIATQAAKVFPRKPTDTRDPFILRLVGVVQFGAGAFLALKVPKARAVGLGLCIAGLQDGIRRNVPSLAPYLGADDEAMLAYQPIEAPVDLNGESYYMAGPIDLGADDNFLAAAVDLGADDNFLAAAVDLGADESDRYGY